MNATTLYRVHIAGPGQAYVSGVDATGKPYSWVARAQARLFCRADAEAVAQLLAEYLLGCPSAGTSVARTVRVSPVSGGITHWRPNTRVARA